MEGKSRGISGVMGAILLLLIGVVIVLIWDHLWNNAQGTPFILDDLLVFISQIVAGSIAIGTIKIPILGIVIVITFAGITFGLGTRKS